MKKTILIFLLICFITISTFATEYYVGENAKNLHILKGYSTHILLYEQDNKLKCLSQDTNNNFIENHIFDDDSIETMQGLKINKHGIPFVVFVGNKNNSFGIFYSFLNSNDEFSELQFIPFERKNFSRIEEEKIEFYSSFIYYSFIMNGKIYIYKFDVSTREYLTSFILEDIKEINHYEIVYKDGDLYGYFTINSKYENLYLFSIIDNNYSKENVVKDYIDTESIKLVSSYFSNIYCILSDSKEKKVYKYIDNQFLIICKTALTEENPGIIYDSFEETKKIVVLENTIIINDSLQTQIEYDFYRLIPYKDYVLLIVHNNKGWFFIKSDYSTTLTKQLEIDKGCQFLRFYLDDSDNVVFYNKLDSTLIIYNLWTLDKINTLSIDLQVDDAISYTGENLFILNLNNNGDTDFIVVQDTIFKTERYKEIDYLFDNRNCYCYAILKTNDCIEIKSFFNIN